MQEAGRISWHDDGVVVARTREGAEVIAGDDGGVVVAEGDLGTAVVAPDGGGVVVAAGGLGHAMVAPDGGSVVVCGGGGADTALCWCAATAGCPVDDGALGCVDGGAEVGVGDLGAAPATPATLRGGLGGSSSRMRMGWLLGMWLTGPCLLVCRFCATASRCVITGCCIRTKR